ncbi:hypothetical protein DWZ62_07925 [Ruminococcus sp. AF34-12]|nr:hypothetical protein DWZ62_07925 [Ruminococcus sp. AF34-12]
MIVKIFCAVLVALGVSVAIVLGGLIILAYCASGSKKPAGDNTADDEDSFMYTNYMQGFYL